MKDKLNKEENIRLILFAVFSFTFLTIWNSFFLKPEDKKVETKSSVVEKEEKIENLERSEVGKEISLKEFKIDGENFSISGNLNKNGRLTISELSSKSPKETKLIQNGEEIVFDFNNSKLSDFNFDISVSNRKNYIEIIAKNKDLELIRKISVIDPRGIEIESHFKNNSSNEMKIVPYFYFKKLSNSFEEAISGSGEIVKRFSSSDLKKDILINFSDWIALRTKNFSILINEDSKNVKFIKTPSDFEKGYSRFGKFGSDSSLAKFDQSVIKNELFTLPNHKKLLLEYEGKYSLKNLEKIVNFGAFFFIVEPILYLMNIFYAIFQNYAVAIVMLTILFKVLTLPLLNKSYKGMVKMKSLNPQIELIKEKYKEDKVLMQKEIMALYKSNNINPLTSMIPMLIQLPFFFAFYKVFSIAFELNGAHGFCWIKDLSETEGNLLFSNLPNIPSVLKIGPMAILMGLTTWLQQKTSPMSGGLQGGDSSQEFAMKIMPFFFVFISSSFPSGLLIYWITGNIFSIIHQLIYKRI